MSTWLIFFVCSFCVLLTASIDVFTKVGSSVQLDIQNAAGSYIVFTWMCNKSTPIMQYFATNTLIPNPEYEDRMEFSDKTYSLTLKNLQKKDRGLYQPEVQNATAKFHLGTYNLYVLDPVEKPKLYVDKQQGSCNVTCSDNKLSINTSYYNETCDKRNETSHEVSHHSLLLYVNGTFIICNASNRVSSDSASLDITDVKERCSPKDSLHSDKPNSYILWIVVLVIVMMIILICLIVYWFRRAKNRQELQIGSTVYEEVKDNKQPRPVEMTERSDLPHTVYSTVSAVPNTQAARTPMSPADSNIYEKTADEGLNYNAVECTKPQTIYAMVNKNGKPTLED